jgi:hypothetical protein
MKLLTKAIEKQLDKVPLGTHDQSRPEDMPIIAKFFTPDANWTWFVIEGEKEADGDWLFYGLVDGQEEELGSFRLSDLEGVRGPWGLKIERDRLFSGTLAECWRNGMGQ